MTVRTCAWTGREFEGKAFLIPTTEGTDIVSPHALVGLLQSLYDTSHFLIGEVHKMQHPGEDTPDLAHEFGPDTMDVPAQREATHDEMGEVG